jgi:hypothetical protein
VTVTIAFSDGAIDGGLRSSDSGSYSNALAGSVFIGSSGAAAGGWGAWYVDGIYNAYQSFLYFDFTPPGSDETPHGSRRTGTTSKSPMRKMRPPDSISKAGRMVSQRE